MEPINKPNPAGISVSPQLQTFFNAHKDSLKNKSIALLFLDKIQSLTGTAHKDFKEIHLYGYGSSLLSSINMIEYLEKLIPKISDPKLKEVVKTWVEEEKKYTKYADQIDTWRAKPEIIKFILSHEGKGPNDKGPTPTFHVPDSEIESLAEQIERDIAALQPGQCFKMLGGTSMHETRIRVEKTDGGNLRFIVFDTAEQIEAHITQKEFPKSFWVGLLKLKLTEYDPDKIKEALLRNGAQVVKSPFPKSRQLTNSCPSQAVLADLKHQIVSQLGNDAYKDLKKMLIHEVAQSEKGKLDPIIEKYLTIKAELKGDNKEYKRQRKREFYEQTIEEAIKDKTWNRNVSSWLQTFYKFFSWGQPISYETDVGQFLREYFLTADNTGDMDKVIKTVMRANQAGVVSSEAKKMIFSYMSRFEILKTRELFDQPVHKAFINLMDGRIEGDFSGFDIELARRAARYIGHNPTFVFEWSKKLIEAGKRDEAVAVLIEILNRHPDWVSNNKGLITNLPVDVQYALPYHVRRNDSDFLFDSFKIFIEKGEREKAIEILFEMFMRYPDFVSNKKDFFKHLNIINLNYSDITKRDESEIFVFCKRILPFFRQDFKNELFDQIPVRKITQLGKVFTNPKQQAFYDLLETGRVDLNLLDAVSIMRVAEYRSRDGDERQEFANFVEQLAPYSNTDVVKGAIQLIAEKIIPGHPELGRYLDPFRSQS